MKAVVAAFNQEKALVGAFSVITNLRMQLFEALVDTRLERQLHSAAGGYLQLLQPEVVCRLHRLPHLVEEVPHICSRRKTLFLEQDIFIYEYF